MRRRISRAAGAVVACVIMGAASAASASAGNGIRLGGSEGRLHPFLDYETRYDSNVAFATDTQELSDVILHIRPGLELKVPGEMAVVELSGAVDWAQYLGIDDAATEDLSKLYADAGLAVLLYPRGPVSVRLDDDFQRRVSNSSLALATAVIANTNTLTLSVPWKPGGGALVLTPRGQWTLESYQSFYDETDVSDLGFNELRGGLDLQWKFLPRTSATFHGAFFSRMPEVSGRPDDTSGVELLAGVNGLVTPHVGVSIEGGYGGTVGSDLGFSTFLAEAAAEWLPVEGASLRVGYSRAFGLDPTASVFTTNGGYATARIRLARRFALRATGRYDHLSFDELPSSSGDTTGTAAFIRAEPAVDVAITRWMSATLAYAYTSRDSSVPDDIPMIDYTKNEAWLKLGFTY